MKNPNYVHDDMPVLQFDHKYSAVVTPALPDHTALMHRNIVESFLDNRGISWAAHDVHRPRLSVVVKGRFDGVMVAWPFKLTGPLPYSVLRDFTSDEIVKVPAGANYIIYGGL